MLIKNFYVITSEKNNFGKFISKNIFNSILIKLNYKLIS